VFEFESELSTFSQEKAQQPVHSEYDNDEVEATILLTTQPSGFFAAHSPDVSY